MNSTTIVWVPKGRDSAFWNNTPLADVIPEFPGRKLDVQTEEIKYIKTSGKDIVANLQTYGGVGVCGTDTLLESAIDDAGILDGLGYLPIGDPMCRVSLMIKQGTTLENMWNETGLQALAAFPVYTTFPNIAACFFEEQDVKAPTIRKRSGAVEAYAGDSSSIIDIVESGKSRDENELVEVVNICSVGANLVYRLDDFQKTPTTAFARTLPQLDCDLDNRTKPSETYSRMFLNELLTPLVKSDNSRTAQPTSLLHQ